MKQGCHFHPVHSELLVYTWKCSSTLNSASSEGIYGRSVAENSLAEMKKNKKEKEACTPLPIHQGLKEKSNRNKLAEEEKNEPYTTVQANFYVLLPGGT